MEGQDLDRAKQQIDKVLREKEGERFKPYRCSAGIPTIGVGATTYPDGRKVTMRDPPITTARMNEMLAIEIDRAVDTVLEMVNHEATTQQLVALVVCGYNIGFNGLRTSSIVKAHNRGDFASAAQAFGLWDKVRNPKTGQLERNLGLAARRAQEAAIYLAGSVTSSRPAQAVASESKLSRSPLMQAGTAVTTAGLAVMNEAVTTPAIPAVPTLAQANDTAAQATSLVGHLQTAAGAFGVSTTWILGILLIGAGGVVMYWRWRQRAEGRA